MIRIFIADDHAIVRHGLRQLIDAQIDMRVVGEAQDGRQVLLAAGKESWDLLLLDLSLPRVNGLEVLRRLHAELPALRIVALSMYPEEQYGSRVLHEGAAAYVSKQQPPKSSCTRCAGHARWHLRQPQARRGHERWRCPLGIAAHESSARVSIRSSR